LVQWLQQFPAYYLQEKQNGQQDLAVYEHGERALEFAGQYEAAPILESDASAGQVWVH